MALGPQRAYPASAGPQTGLSWPVWWCPSARIPIAQTRWQCACLSVSGRIGDFRVNYRLDHRCVRVNTPPLVCHPLVRYRESAVSFSTSSLPRLWGFGFFPFKSAFLETPFAFRRLFPAFSLHVLSTFPRAFPHRFPHDSRGIAGKISSWFRGDFPGKSWVNLGRNVAGMAGAFGWDLPPCPSTKVGEIVQPGAAQSVGYCWKELWPRKSRDRPSGPENNRGRGGSREASDSHR